MIDRGELGEIERITWIGTDWFRTKAYYRSSAWRATWKGEGGGVLLNQCPHQLDLLQWMCGMPSSIQAFCDLGFYHDIEVEDRVTAFMRYPNGATGVFITSTGEAPGTNRLEIAGEMGKLVLEGGELTFTRNEVSARVFCDTSDALMGTPEIWNAQIPITGTAGLHAEITQNFVDAVLDGKPLIAPAEEGIKSIELANAMLYSSLKSTSVELPLDGAAFEIELQRLIDASSSNKR